MKVDESLKSDAQEKADRAAERHRAMQQQEEARKAAKQAKRAARGP